MTPTAFGVDSLTYNNAGLIGPAAAAKLAAATSPAVATSALATGAVIGGLFIGLLPIRAHDPDACPPVVGQLVAGGRILAAVTGVPAWASSGSGPRR